MTKGRGVAAGVLAVIAMFALTACGSHAGSGTLIGVRFTDSIGSGGKANGCIQPGSRITTQDKVYYLPGPGNQRQDQWQSGNNAADHTDLVAYTKDGVQVNVVLNENFSLQADCDSLDQFMKTIGLTRQAYFENDSTYKPGWITAMNYYISPVVVKRVKTQVAKYDADELWPSTKLYESGTLCDAIDGPAVGDMKNTMEAEVAANTNGNNLYTSFRCDISSVEPNSDYQTIINERTSAKVKAQTAKINQQQQVAQAKADAAVAKANAQVVKAKVSAFGSGPAAMEAYLKSLVIEGGGNPFQPNGTLITPNTGQ